MSKTVATDGLLIFMYEMTCNRSKLNFKTVTLNFFSMYDDILTLQAITLVVINTALFNVKKI